MTHVLTLHGRYQRRVDRGEVRAPTDQDRANYVNWKRNYIAWLAKKRGEEAREQVSRRER